MGKRGGQLLGRRDNLKHHGTEQGKITGMKSLLTISIVGHI